MLVRCRGIMAYGVFFAHLYFEALWLENENIFQIEYMCTVAVRGIVVACVSMDRKWKRIISGRTYVR